MTPNGRDSLADCVGRIETDDDDRDGAWLLRRRHRLRAAAACGVDKNALVPISNEVPIELLLGTRSVDRSDRPATTSVSYQRHDCVAEGVDVKRLDEYSVGGHDDIADA